ncbi:MAG: cytochrome c oxidase accessory protein CcoG, partial [Halobacteria archaeon]|nr:cytochrome c oxidase accessory protein CcoG [Halobacteria archaeon]
AWSLLNRTPLGLDVIRDRNQLYRETSEGLIENVYILKILNMDGVAHTYDLTASGIRSLELHMDLPSIRVASGGVLELPVRLRVEEGDLEARSSSIVFELVAEGDSSLAVTEEARFLGPM